MVRNQPDPKFEELLRSITPVYEALRKAQFPFEKGDAPEPERVPQMDSHKTIVLAASDSRTFKNLCMKHLSEGPSTDIGELLLQYHTLKEIGAIDRVQQR